MVEVLSAAKVLTQADYAALAAYCQTFGRWVEAEQFLKKHGTTFCADTQFGRKYFPYPQVRISQDNLKLMKSFLIEFGMSPASRARVALPEHQEQKGLEALLDG